MNIEAKHSNEHNIKPDESIPTDILWKSGGGLFEIKVKEEINVYQEPIKIKPFKIKLKEEKKIDEGPIEFTWGSYLVKNEHTYTEERSYQVECKPYQCSKCEKDLSYKSIHINHMGTHTVENPHQCSQCDKAFSTNDYLIIHQRSHTAEKPYQCHHCNK
ncbi:unnamed protein product, partial [Meganyctiphanes norvegica]